MLGIDHTYPGTVILLRVNLVRLMLVGGQTTCLVPVAGRAIPPGERPKAGLNC